MNIRKRWFLKIIISSFFTCDFKLTKNNIYQNSFILKVGVFIISVPTKIERLILIIIQFAILNNNGGNEHPFLFSFLIKDSF